MDTQQLILTEIANACYFYRCYWRPCSKVLRAQAVIKLAETIHHALGNCKTHEGREAVLTALADGLRPPEKRNF